MRYLLPMLVMGPDIMRLTMVRCKSRRRGGACGLEPLSPGQQGGLQRQGRLDWPHWGRSEGPITPIRSFHSPLSGLRNERPLLRFLPFEFAVGGSRLTSLRDPSIVEAPYRAFEFAARAPVRDAGIFA